MPYLKDANNILDLGAREGGIAFFRDFEERRLSKELNESRAEITAGKGKVLHSLVDLD